MSKNYYNEKLAPGVYLRRHLAREGSPFRLRFYDANRHPKTKEINLRTDFKPLAMKDALQYLSDYRMGLFDPWVDKTTDLTFSEAMKLYERGKTGPANAYTISNILGVIKPLAAQFPDNMPLSQVTPAHIQAYVYRHHLSAGTQFTYYNKLENFFNFIVGEGYLDESPVAGVRKPRKPRNDPKYLTPAQIKILLDTIQADYEIKVAKGYIQPNAGVVLWLKDLILITVGAGLRRNEVLGLRWSAITWPEYDESGQQIRPGFLHVASYKKQDGHYYRPKHDSTGRIPMLPFVERVLRRLDQERKNENPDEYIFLNQAGNGPKNGHDVSKRFRFYRNLAKLPAVPFHGLRHSTAHMCRSQGVPLEIIQRIMRHSDIKQTMAYGNFTDHETPARFLEALKDVDL